MAGKRPKGSPEKIGRLITTRFEGSALGARLKDLAVWQVWDQVVGPAIARRTRPLRLSGGQLTVLVSGAPWMQQLNFMKEDLNSKLNLCLGEDRVKAIIFKAGRAHEPADNLEETTKPLLPPLSPERRDWIEQQIADIDDPGLALSIKSLMELHYRRHSAD